MAKHFSSIKDQNKEGPGIRESFRAFIYLPRFSKEIWQTNPSIYLLNLVTRLFSAFVPVVILWIGKLIIDEIILQTQSSPSDPSRLWIWIGIELGVVILSDLLARTISLTDGLLGDLYANKSSVQIIKKTEDIEISELEDPDFYDKMERARTQTTGRVSLMSNLLSQGESLISMGSLIAGLIYFEPWLIALLILSIIPAFINEIRFSNASYSLARSWTAERRELDYLRYVGANDKTAKEIKLFGLTSFIANRFEKLSHHYYTLNKKLAIKRSGYGALFNVLGTVTYYGAYILIILRVLNGTLTLGELTFLSGSFNRLRNNLQAFFSRFTRISESALYLKDYFDFIDLKTHVPSTGTLPVPSKLRIGFVVENLSFAYPGSDTYVLEDVNFTLKAGEKLAFVGENGAGKTTLIKLMLRFYEPTSGRILLEGKDIRDYDKKTYQQMFGVIFQDFFRYEFTVKENIAVGKIEELDNMERIRHASDLSLASEVIQQLKKGYDQQLGKRFIKGQELSGGQWQKIALARAYMKDAPVLILDEPTSALDAKAEYEVFERFIGLTEGKTAIIISHRFSTVRMADRILVLQHGKTLEIGTHEELMANGKLYAELFSLQAAGYQ